MPPSRSSTARLAHQKSTRSLKSELPERVQTDVILTIRPSCAESIHKGEKNHEFRGYLLRSSVERLWLYESAPRCAIRFVMQTAEPKSPGEVRDPSGFGNDAFDAGEIPGYAYPVRALYKLQTPLTREAMKTRFNMQSPQGYRYANQKLVQELTLDQMERVF